MSTSKNWIILVLLAALLGVGIGYLLGKDSSPAPIIIEKAGQ